MQRHTDFSVDALVNTEKDRQFELGRCALAGTYIYTHKKGPMMNNTTNPISCSTCSRTQTCPHTPHHRTKMYPHLIRTLHFSIIICQCKRVPTRTIKVGECFCLADAKQNRSLRLGEGRRLLEHNLSQEAYVCVCEPRDREKKSERVSEKKISERRGKERRVRSNIAESVCTRG